MENQNTAKKDEQRPDPRDEAVERLERLEREVAEDARKKPDEYLRDTNVPAGGE